MAEPLSVSLQAFPPPDKNKESLQYLIERVNAQRGSFRNVTEEILEDEIRREEAGEENNDNGDPTTSLAGVVETKTKKEEVTEAREEIVKQTAQALQESSMALEFVSLLLSKYNSATAQATMSPFIKETLPLGSLGAEVVQEPQVPEPEKHNEEITGIGWRMQSLNSATDSLLQSASRLEEEMDRETRYWEQVLAVKEKGWSLHRLPREKHTLGVRYGFAEAYSDFHDRGLAALRRDEDGNLNLDRGVRWKGDRKLRVRILDHGKPVASNLENNVITTEDASVEKEILNARDSIFDEELHHELDREARNLVNQGVRCIDGNILITYEIAKQIEISLVPWDEQAPGEPESGDPVPHAIATSLRILLCHAHHQNLQKRSQIPPPLRENKPPRPTYALLKPIIEYLQHRSHIKSTQTFLNEIHDTLVSAQLDITVEQPASSHDLRSLLHTSTHSDKLGADTLLRSLTAPLHTSWTLSFPHEPTTITIDIHTAIQPPHFGTIFRVTAQGSAQEQSIGTLPQSEHFTTTTTFQAYVLHLAASAMQQRIVSELGSDWRSVPGRGYSMTRNDPKAQVKIVVSIYFRHSSQLQLTWRCGSTSGGAFWTGEVPPGPPGVEVMNGLVDAIRRSI